MNAVITLICLGLSSLTTGRPTELPWGGRDVVAQHAPGRDNYSPRMSRSDALWNAVDDRDKSGTTEVGPKTRNPQGVDSQRLTDFQQLEAEGMGFEAGDEIDGTGEADCSCDFCLRFRAARALHSACCDCLGMASADADLRTLLDGWRRLPVTIREAILTLVAG